MSALVGQKHAMSEMQLDFSWRNSVCRAAEANLSMACILSLLQHGYLVQGVELKGNLCQESKTDGTTVLKAPKEPSTNTGIIYGKRCAEAGEADRPDLGYDRPVKNKAS